MSSTSYPKNEPLAISEVEVTTHSKFLSQRRFGSLDGLRAISIIGVIWHHTAAAGMGAPWANIGSQGVSLFFAISGFLITTLLLRERGRNGEIDLKAFYFRRMLRIFPLYYGVLLIYIIVVFLMERNSAVGQGFFNNIIYFATYTSNIFVPLDGRVIFYFAWSLAAEEQFYIIWPLLLCLTVTLAKASVPLCFVFLACVMSHVFGIKFLSEVPLAIVTSALLAIGLHSKKCFPLLQFILGRTWSSVAFGIALIVGLTVPVVPEFVLQILFTAFVGSCVIREDNHFAPLFLLKPVAYIGTISYGMYMLHMLCKNAVAKLANTLKFSVDGLEVFSLTLVAAIIAATLSFKYYESFFMKLKTVHER